MEDLDFSKLDPELKQKFVLAKSHPLTFAETFLIEPRSGEPFTANYAQRKVLKSTKRNVWFALHRRAGKALTLDSIVHTPFGPKRMGHIAIGDMVLSPDGLCCEVLDWIPNGKRDVYELTTDDGVAIQASDDHEWVVYDNVDGGLKTVTTMEIHRSLQKGEQRYSVESAAPLEFEQGLDPLFSGTPEQRRSALEVLIARIERPANRQQAERLAECYRSLGCWAAVRSDSDGWSVEARCTEDFPVKGAVRGSTSRYFIKSEYVGRKDVACISISGEDNLFLTNGYLVTHNCLAGSVKVLDPETLVPTPISELAGSRKTLTYDFGANKVVTTECEWVSSGTRACVSVELMSGRRLVLTHDHLLYCKDRGWVKAVELSTGSQILAPTEVPVFGNVDLDEDAIQELAETIADLSTVPDMVYGLSKLALSRLLFEVWARRGRLMHAERMAVFFFWNKQTSLAIQHLLQRFGVTSILDTDGNLFIGDRLDLEVFLKSVGLPREVTDVKSPRRWEFVMGVYDAGVRDTYDLVVDHPDHNFLAEDIVVHNSFVLSVLALWHATTFENNRVLVFTPAKTQLVEFFQNIDDWIGKNPFLQALQAKEGNYKSPSQRRTFVNGSYIDGNILGLSEGLEAARRGLTGDVIIVDEAQELGDSDWKVLDPIIQGDRYRMDKIRSYIAGTINLPVGRFFEKITRWGPDEVSDVIFLPITKNKDYTPEQVEQLRKQTPPEIWQTEWLLQVSEGDDAVFKKSEVEDARKYDWEYGIQNIREDCVRFVGVDWDKVQAGTNIVVVQYDPNSGLMEVIYREEVERGKFTYTNAVNSIIEIYEAFQPELVVTDQGQGEAQWELLMIESQRRGIGLASRLMKLSFSSKIEITNPETLEPEKKLVKPFLVGLLQRKLQDRRFRFPRHDEALFDQLILYRVVRQTANTTVYSSTNEHIIDCILFAMYGLFLTYENIFDEHASQGQDIIRQLKIDDLYSTDETHVMNMWDQILGGRTDFVRRGGIFRSDLFDL